MQPGKHRAIVIGGGIAGLAAAIYLARQGKSVRLLEQSSALGGRARTKEQDGFHLNLGPHALYRAGRGIEVLAELGVEPRGQIPSVSGAFAIADSVKHTFPAGFVSLLTTSLFNLPAKLEAGRLLGSLAKIDSDSVMSTSLAEWVNTQITHPRVRSFLMAAFRVATYTNAPEIMSAGAAIEQLKKAFGKSVLYLDGGWQTLVDDLALSAERAGVVIETNAKVESIERSAAGAVQAVRLSHNQVYEAATVVIASSPAVAARLVERGRQSLLAKWADAAIPVKAACLDVALSRLPRPNATFALGIDEPHYLSVHSATARLAPEGGAMIHLARYLSPDEDGSLDYVERGLEKMLDLVQPGWREALVYKRFLPDLVVMNAIATARQEGTRGRPGPVVEDVPGLYVVGDWVGKEGMLVDASLASAKQAAEIIAAAPAVKIAASV